MVYPPRNLVGKDAHTTLSCAILPLSRTTTRFKSTSPYPQKKHSPPQTARTSPFQPRRHATCAKVIQFSGAAENTDKHDRVVEDFGVNGSSAEVLGGALLKSMNQPI